MDSSSSKVEEYNDQTLWGHPIGLYVCFATELWERFSFYGMKFLLLLYLTKYHLFSDKDGLSLVGSYAGLVYALPLLGGLLADRYLGMRKAVVFGGILLVMGHLLMAVEGTQAVEVNNVVVRDAFAINVFYLALALIVVGVGFLKPNISTIVGKLYPENDPRRDSGFTVFYQGINIGSFVATIICAWLGETYGWSYGFGAAGLGMLIGLVTFLWGQKYLYGHAEPNNPETLKERFIGPINKEWAIYLFSILALGVVWFLVQKISIVFLTQNLFLLLSITGLIYFSIFYKNNTNSSRIVAKVLAAVILVIGLFGVLGFTIDHFPKQDFADLDSIKWLTGSVISIGSYIDSWGFSLLGESYSGLGSPYWLHLTGYILLAAIVIFSLYGFIKSSTAEYSRMIVLIVLIVSTIVFWALFEQSASSLTLFADRVVDRAIIDISISNGDLWLFCLAAAILLGLSGYGFYTANNYRKTHQSTIFEVSKVALFVLALDLSLVLGYVAYHSYGFHWLANLSYLAIFILLLSSVIKAIALAFILIGFFYRKDKSNSISVTDATVSAWSIFVIATALFLAALGLIYYGFTTVHQLSDGEHKDLIVEPTAGQFGALNALFIFTLAPVFAALWVKLGKLNLDPNTPVKFSLGLIQVGLGFGALLLGALTPNELGKVSWVWLMLAYLLHTTGELSLSPVGLSAVTKLSIKSVTGMVMGVWFLATSLSEVVAVLLAKVAALDKQELETLSVLQQLEKYNHLWLTLLYLGVGFGLFMLVISPLLKRGMKGIH